MKNLIFTILICCCSIVFGQNKKFEFSKNIGHVVDQNGNPNNKVKFLGSLPGINIQILENGYAYDSYKETYASSKDEDGTPITRLTNIEFDRIDFTFENTTGSSQFIYNDINGNSFLNIGEKKTKLENTKSILQKELYPNIDIEYLFTEGAFKYNITVKEGANLSDIEINIGSNKPAEIKNGNLSIPTTFGTITESIPLSFYNDNKEEITINYNLDGNKLTFTSTEEIEKKEFTIDPIGTLNRTWGTYFGGERNDEIKSSTLDDEGNVYITGFTNSTMSVASTGAYHTTYDGTEASISYLGTAYIAKMGQDGQLIWASYYGAVGVETSSVFDDIAIHNNEIYVAGSADPNFEMVNATQFATHQGGSGEGDVVLMKLDVAGNPIWSSYFGGANREKARSLAVNETGIYVTGFVKTDGLGTATTSQPTLNGTTDAFVLKFSLNGFTDWFTYLGGSDSDYGTSLTFKNNSLFIAGSTYSDDFATTPGVFQPNRAASSDMYIVEMDLTSQINKATYFGGIDSENYYQKKLDFVGNDIVFSCKTIIATVNTTGKFNPTPTNVNSRQSLLCILSQDFSTVDGTYVGATTTTYMADETYCVFVDSDENIWVSGITKYQANIATPDGHTTTLPIPELACDDGFISKYNTDLTQLLYGSYIANGGPASGNMQNNGGEKVTNMHEYNNTIVITGDIYGSGSLGTDYGVGPIATAGSHDTNFEAQGSNAGRFEGFIMAFCADDMHANLIPSQIYEDCPDEEIIVTPAENYVGTTWTGSEMSGDFAPTFGTTGEYTLTTVDEYGCTSDTTFTLTFDGEQVEINVTDPNLGTVNTAEVDENTTIQLEIQSGFNTVSWTSNGGIDCDNCDQTSYGATTEDEIIVEVEDVNGCITSDTLQITITEVVDPVEPIDPIEPTPADLDTLALIIPQGFSPNGDGMNDLFEIEGISTLEVDVTVWNRWGGIVYTSSNYKNDWNGSCQGEGCLGSGLVPEGTYFYSILKGEKIYKGYITIKK